MSMILESDIIYNILPHVDLETIGKLFCVNKFVNKLCNDKYFWKSKFSDKYKNFIAKSEKWLCEYKCVSLAHMQAIKFVDHFIEMGNLLHSCLSRDYYVITRNIIDHQNLYWIPDKLKLRLLSEGVYSSVFFGMNCNNTGSLNDKPFYVSLSVRHRSNHHSHTSDLYVSKQEFVDYITKIHYDYGNFTMYEYNDDEILFMDYINK